MLLIGEMWNGKFIGNVERQLYLYGSLIRKDSFVLLMEWREKAQLEDIN